MNTQLSEAIKNTIAKMDAQGQKSMTPSKSGCLYRAPEPGVCCFVGHMMHDEDYSPEMEGTMLTVSTFDGANQIKLAVDKFIGCELTEPEVELLQTIQHVHDERWAPRRQTFTEALNVYRKLDDSTDGHLKELGL